MTLVGALLMVALIPFFLESSSTEELLSTVILAALFLLVTFLFGILPLRKGIAIRKNPIQTKQVVNREASSPAVKKQTAASKQEKSSVNPASATPFPPFTGAESRVLFRDKQFDDGDKPVILFFTKIILCAALPIILAIFGFQLLSESVNHHIEPGTIQAYMSLFLVVAASFLSAMSIALLAKYNAIGNKFYYYIFDRKDGLYFAHMGLENLGCYVQKNTPLFEKIKESPSFLYVILFLFSRQWRAQAYRLAKMQMYFKVNQKFHFVEKLLLSDDYAGYCHKVVSVKNIRYFSKGCEVTLLYLRKGVEVESKQIIYHETENYDLLMNKIKELQPNARIGYELSENQLKQVRKNMYRRTAVLLLGVCILACVFVGSFNTYFTANYKASVLSPGFFQIMQERLAYRSMRRIAGIIFFFFSTILVAFGKIIYDFVKTDHFTYHAVEVTEYFESRESIFKKMLSDYRYFAKVKYNNSTITVGLSKEMWDKKDSVTPLLVFRKQVPYCLIFKDTMNP